ncbi:hypothetical protein EVAR_91304_1, partial [Eumeta japonica]
MLSANGPPFSGKCNLSPPLQITGTDFAGPFELKTSPLRKSSTIK